MYLGHSGLPLAMSTHLVASSSRYVFLRFPSLRTTWICSLGRPQVRAVSNDVKMARDFQGAGKGVFHPFLVLLLRYLRVGCAVLWFWRFQPFAADHSYFFGVVPHFHLQVSCVCSMRTCTNSNSWFLGHKCLWGGWVGDYTSFHCPILQFCQPDDLVEKDPLVVKSFFPMSTFFLLKKPLP